MTTTKPEDEKAAPSPLEASVQEKTKDLTARLMVIKAKLAKDRDELREWQSDAEAVLDSCDRADEALETAIDALSELL